MRNIRAPALDRATLTPATCSIAVVASTDFCVWQYTTSVANNGKYDQLGGIHISTPASAWCRATPWTRFDTGGNDVLVAPSMGEPLHDVAYLDNTTRGGRYGCARANRGGHAGAEHLTITGNRFWLPGGPVNGYYSGGGPVSNVNVRNNDSEAYSGPSIDFYGTLTGICSAVIRPCTAVHPGSSAILATVSIPRSTATEGPSARRSMLGDDLRKKVIEHHDDQGNHPLILDLWPEGRVVPADAVPIARSLSDGSADCMSAIRVEKGHKFLPIRR